MVRVKTSVIIPQVGIDGIYYPTGLAVAHEECECAIIELMEEIYEIEY